MRDGGSTIGCMSLLVVPEPVQVTVWVGGEQLVVDVPAGPLPADLPEAVVRHLVEAGRAAPEALRDAADTVSDIGNEKHAFKAGIKAMPGLDW